MTTPLFSPRFIEAYDGTPLRTAVFEAKDARAVCVLLQGHCEFIEKYGEVFSELNSRGFTVAAFDWRGQGGSARALPDSLKAHVRDFAEYDSDLTAFLERIVRPLSPEPPLLLGHSMGGHLALRALHDWPGAFRAAVLVSPMVAILTGAYPGWVTRLAVALHMLAGRSEDFAWGMAERDPLRTEFSRQLCTSDPERFARTQEIIKANPAIRLAGPSWSWLAAAYRSMAQVTAPGYAEAIQTPVLMFGAGHDRIVRVEATARLAARLPHGTYVGIEEAEHEILMERDPLRARVWSAFDAFVERTV